jgi:hypothetical protein
MRSRIDAKLAAMSAKIPDVLFAQESPPMSMEPVRTPLPSSVVRPTVARTNFQIDEIRSAGSTTKRKRSGFDFEEIVPKKLDDDLRSCSTVQTSVGDRLQSAPTGMGVVESRAVPLPLSGSPISAGKGRPDSDLSAGFLVGLLDSPVEATAPALTPPLKLRGLGKKEVVLSSASTSESEDEGEAKRFNTAATLSQAANSIDKLFFEQMAVVDLQQALKWASFPPPLNCQI